MSSTTTEPPVLKESESSTITEQRVLKEPVSGQLLYSVEQAARVLGLSPRLVWSFVASNQLKVRRVGARVLVHRRELEKFALRDHATKVNDE